jgi:predicted RecA/RadA family phage recombinase
MKSYIQPGQVMTFTAPYQRNSGQGALIGAIFGVATKDVANAAQGEFMLNGVHSLNKTSAQAWTEGRP